MICSNRKLLKELKILLNQLVDNKITPELGLQKLLVLLIEGVESHVEENKEDNKKNNKMVNRIDRTH